MDADAPATSLLRPDLAARLAAVLHGITVRDLAALPDYILVDSVEPRDRLAMTVAVRTALEPFLKPDHDDWSASTRPVKCWITVRPGGEAPASTRLVAIELYRPVELAVAAIRAAAGGLDVVGLDVSYQNLVDEDMSFLPPLVRQLPACATVVLSHNRFDGSSAFWPHLRALLDVPHVAKVDGSYNAAIHLAHREDLKLLSNHACFDKLVWIYSQKALDTVPLDDWVEGDAERIAAIKAFHAAHYAAAATEGGR